MTKKEIDKIITEFMGEQIAGDQEECSKCGYESQPVILDKDGSVWNIQLYTDSVDALIPVVEKLNKDVWLQYYIKEKFWYGWFSDMGDESVQDKSPSMALATACAKVIQELNE